MLRIRIGLLFFFIMFVAATKVNAVTLFTANLTGAQEAPIQGSPIAFGTATFILNDAQTALSFTATVFGVDFGANPLFNNPQTPGTGDDLLNAHIHCCAPPGSAASVRWGFIGSPFNNSTAANVAGSDLVVTPFSSGVGGTVSGKWDALEGNNTTLAA